MTPKSEGGREPARLRPGEKNEKQTAGEETGRRGGAQATAQPWSARAGAPASTPARRSRPTWSRQPPTLDIRSLAAQLEQTPAMAVVGTVEPQPHDRVDTDRGDRGDETGRTGRTDRDLWQQAQFPPILLVETNPEQPPCSPRRRS